MNKYLLSVEQTTKDVIVEQVQQYSKEFHLNDEQTKFLAKIPKYVWELQAPRVVENVSQYPEPVYYNIKKCAQKFLNEPSLVSYTKRFKDKIKKENKINQLEHYDFVAYYKPHYGYHDYHDGDEYGFGIRPLGTKYLQKVARLPQNGSYKLVDVTDERALCTAYEFDGWHYKTWESLIKYYPQYKSAHNLIQKALHEMKESVA